jgi:hypothetical protein
MARFELDLDQIRKNWELAETLPAPDAAEERQRPSLPSRTEAAGELLQRIRGLARAEVGPRWPSVAPFFDEADRLIRLLASSPPEGGPPGAAPPDPKALRSRLSTVLMDLEDLLAVYTGMHH